jgi:hypothetical protein
MKCRVLLNAKLSFFHMRYISTSQHRIKKTLPEALILPSSL